MTEVQVINLFSQFGFAAIMAGLLFLALERRTKQANDVYERHITMLAEVIRNNTQAMTEMYGVVDQVCDTLGQHDVRAQAIQASVENNRQAMVRIEAILDRGRRSGQ